MKRYSYREDRGSWVVVDTLTENIVQQGLYEDEARAYAAVLNGETPGEHHEGWDRLLADVRKR